MNGNLRYCTRVLNLFVLLNVVCSLAWPGLPEIREDDLRLRLKDKIQIAQTTSINWWDLPALQDLKEELQNQSSRFATSRGIKILLDPGHGGKDLGAPGLYGIREKHLCLKISELLKQELERVAKRSDLQITVQLTRTDDSTLTLSERIYQANRWGADLFVSIHANSSPVRKAQGFEVYFMSAKATDEDAKRLARKENRTMTEDLSTDAVSSILSDVQSTYHVNESSRFAEDIFSAISLRFRSNGRGVRQAPFSVLAGTKMPSVLVEVGYVTHPDEALDLTKFSYLKRLVGAISSGIVDFLMRTKKLG